MYQKHIFYCEDSLEGIFTAVYDAWDMRVGHENVEIRTGQQDNLELFSTSYEISTDLIKAEKVLNTIKRRLGSEITECICFAASSFNEEKSTAIYQTLVDCLSVKGASYGKKRLENRKNPYIRKVLELHRNVWSEYHHYLGFLRFRQISEQVLFGTITPKNDVLLLFQEHFSDRFSKEHWVIYDDKRKKALVHVPFKGCIVYSGDEGFMEQLVTSEDREQDYEQLFQQFCNSISIEERKNSKLQRQNLPLRFREHMTEFQNVTTQPCKVADMPASSQ